ncbi:hypothetical protein AV540_19470 [Brevibacillus parabrevis]|nr:hypothetical protein AV540_19470 [Brevibacillus parabrevis]
MKTDERQMPTFTKRDRRSGLWLVFFLAEKTSLRLLFKPSKSLSKTTKDVAAKSSSHSWGVFA